MWRAGAPAPRATRPRAGERTRENEGPLRPDARRRGNGRCCAAVDDGRGLDRWLPLLDVDVVGSLGGAALGRCGLLLAGRHACDGGSLGLALSIGIMVWLLLINYPAGMGGSVGIRLCQVD